MRETTKEYRRRIRKQTGVAGVDKQGAQLDRRKYHKIKQTLDQLYYQQLALYRNHGQAYKDEPLLFNNLNSGNNSVFDTYHVAVRKDGKAWRAWQQTPNSWHFGIGGASKAQDK